MSGYNENDWFSFVFIYGSDDNLSEDDMNECEKEDGLEGEEQDEQESKCVKKKMKKTKGGIPMR